MFDVQAELLDKRSARVVISLKNAKQYKQVRLPQDFLPQFIIKGNRYILETPGYGGSSMFTFKKTSLFFKRPSKSNYHSHRPLARRFLVYLKTRP
ncbi:CcdB family protein [Polynucleobacter kasalickyi]|uniref:CcdB family protein n=1 Tax=Polynucleobacter kasalickyi TaxID=1938817 RepID=UPI000A0420B7